MKKTAVCLLISSAIAFLLLFLADKPFYQILDLKLYDLKMNLRHPPEEDPRILFVEMDAEAIDYLGRWPWPRNILANITNTLTSLGARQVLFDITFAQPNQVFVNKEAAGHVFQGKEEIDNYISDETGILKGKETLSPEDAIWTLNQIQNGFLAFTAIAEDKLQNALIDNDQILSTAFENSPSFIGYSLEVITEQKDILRDKHYPEIRKNISDWVSLNTGKSFYDLPTSLKKNPYFDVSEIHRMFTHAQLEFLLDENIEISLKDVSEKLNVDSTILQPNFTFVKGQIVKEKVESVLNENPQAELIDLIYKFEIFDTDTQRVFEETWLKLKKEFTAQEKFGKLVPNPEGFLKARSAEVPIEPFTTAVSGGGFLNGIPDHDGVLRYVPLFIKYKDTIFAHIVIASVTDLYKPKKISFDPGKHLILHESDVNGEIKDVHIPMSVRGTSFINWTGRWQDTFRHISGADIYRLYFLKDALANAQNPDDIPLLEEQTQEKQMILEKHVRDSICIIGLTAPGTHDFNPIPYEATYPMVGTHGTVLNSILTQQFITRTSPSLDLTILWSLAVVLAIALAFLSSMHGLIFTAVILIGLFSTSLYWFNQGVWFPSASPLVLSLFSYLGITSYRFSTEEKSKREIKSAFSKYVSPDIINEIIKDPSKLRLGGDRKMLTVLFSDIRSFTTYSEKRKPEEVVSILNEYLDAMTKVIFEEKGTLDKYVGDEIMAVFGAPHYEPPEINAQRAVICAMKMLKRLKLLHEKWKEEGLEPLDIGVGANTGEMVTGNIGSELRMDYTVIGDAVNLGARVEALTRDFNAYFIITESTYEYTKDIIEVKPLEPIKVKGKDIPVMIYDVLSLKEDKVEEFYAAQQ